MLGAFGASYIQFVTPKNEKPLSVSLVQGNIPQDRKWLEEYQVKTLEIYSHLTQTEWQEKLARVTVEDVRQAARKMTLAVDYTAIGAANESSEEV